MKARHFSFLVASLFCLHYAHPQTNVSKQEAIRVINAYKQSVQKFVNIEICGTAFDGPAWILKETENRALDKLIDITPEQQAEIGLDFFKEHEQSNLATDGQKLLKARNVFAKLAAFAPKPETDFKVYVIQSKEINAYSTIGGYVYVTTGLLSFVNSDDELAFALGHEMAHIFNKHVIRKEKKIALLCHIGQKMNLEKFSSVALNLSITLSTPFDRIDEYEADRASVDLIKKAGYDATAFNQFFVRLQLIESKDILSKYTDVHPAAANRRKCLNKLIGK